MRIFSRQFSTWWLLLLLPVLVLCGPWLLILPFMLSNLVGGFIGSTGLLGEPWHHVARAELVGKYHESKRNWTQPIYNEADLELRANGTMSVHHLPNGETCTVSGTGSWQIEDGDQINVNVTTDESSDACGSQGYSEIFVRGHSAPYTLFWVIGDPDSDEGVWLTHQ